MEVWKLVARIDGPDSRRHRAEEWGRWFGQVMAKAGSIRGSLARPAEVPVTGAVAEVGRCQRGGGFLERVKLPTFSGSIEDYGEFKCQFKELCRGEQYTGVIELAQLRQKLPKDAVALLVGLVTPDAAWARLDESYGNVDLTSIRRAQEIARIQAKQVGRSRSSRGAGNCRTAVPDRPPGTLQRARFSARQRNTSRGDRRIASGLSTTLVSPRRREERDTAGKGNELPVVARRRTRGWRWQSIWTR